MNEEGKFFIYYNVFMNLGFTTCNIVTEFFWDFIVFDYPKSFFVILFFSILYIMFSYAWDKLDKFAEKENKKSLKYWLEEKK